MGFFSKLKEKFSKKEIFKDEKQKTRNDKGLEKNKKELSDIIGAKIEVSKNEEEKKTEKNEEEKETKNEKKKEDDDEDDGEDDEEGGEEEDN